MNQARDQYPARYSLWVFFLPHVEYGYPAIFATYPPDNMLKNRQNTPIFYAKSAKISRKLGLGNAKQLGTAKLITRRVITCILPFPVACFSVGRFGIDQLAACHLNTSILAHQNGACRVLVFIQAINHARLQLNVIDRVAAQAFQQ